MYSTPRSKLSFAVAAALVLTACGGSDGAARQSISWEQFRAAAYVEPDTGMFITNGDELAETEEELRAQFERFAAQEAAAATGVAELEQPLIVNRVSGRDDRWPAATAASLTYCIDTASFGSRYADVVAAMNSATSAWEATANVNFVHVASRDTSCTSRTSDVVFNVRMVRSQQYLARAFFPSTSRRGREILVSIASFGNIRPWSLPGVLRHELGHAIGFRHEHTRPESGTCFEDTSWRALTGYDAASVMHYPQCNGTNTGDLELTSLDRSGARALYP